MKLKNNYIAKWKRPNKGRIWLLLIAYAVVYSFNSDTIFAQAPAPYSYNTPNFTQVYSSDTEESNNTFLNMNLITEPAVGADALMVEFYVEMDLVKKAKLLKFSIADTNILEVFYEKHSMKLRRYFNDKYYDYELYDALFCMAEASGDPCRNTSPAKGTWHIKFYFSSGFMWIQVTKEQTAARNYLSPLFFGLNFSTNNYMESFLKRWETAKVTFGDDSNYSDFKMPNGVKIYAMKYNDLRKDIQNKFSKAHSAPADTKERAKREINNNFDKVNSVALHVPDTISTINEKNTKNEMDIKNNNKVISIYPNPTSTPLVTIVFEKTTLETTNFKFILSDLSARTILADEIQVKSGMHQTQIKLPNSLAKGVYFLKFSLGIEKGSKTLIVN